MAGLKLSKLPDRTPVKMTITVMPDLHQQLLEYAQAYAAEYSSEEPVSELVPAMIAAFLDADREFSRRRK